MAKYDANMLANYIMYLDANNLYGLAMSQKLPLKGYKWVKDFKVEYILLIMMRKNLKRVVL